MLYCAEGGALADLPSADPAGIVVDETAVLRELASMPTGEREAAALVIDGMSFAEVGDSLGTTAQAIEGRLYRYRQLRA